MKIIGILSSPRGTQSQTLRLARAFENGAQTAGAQVELVDICSLNVRYCRACDVCHRTGICVLKDDFNGLLEKILASDALMLSSPDYFKSVTAQLKTLIDRMARIIHCQLLEGKYACSIATSGGPAGKEIVDYLNEVAESMSAVVVGGVFAAMSNGPQEFSKAEEKARDLGRQLVTWWQDKRDDPARKERRRRTAEYFRGLVERNKERWTWEYEFWQKRATPP